MKIRLTKPLPQPELRRVIPAGTVIDAPPGLAARVLRQGMGKPMHRAEPRQEAVAAPQKAKPGKKVKRNGPA